MSATTTVRVRCGTGCRGEGREMILSEDRLRAVPAAFRAMTGLPSEEFDALARGVVPGIATAVAAGRDRRRGRQARRAAGGGHPFALSFREQLLLAAVWLRVYPTSPVLGFLFGVRHQTVLRTIALVLPILEQAGRDATRLPGHVGIAPLHPTGLGFTPRRKPREKPRPPEDVAYNTAFAAERISVEHTIGRLRRYQALTQPDRHHRQAHTARVRAIAGLVNRQLDHRFGALT